MERVDVYTPEKFKPSGIAREIETKVTEGQASSVIVVIPIDFSKFDMYKTAAAAFGKKRGGKPISLNRVLFLQENKIIHLDRQAINSLRGK